MAEDTVLCHAGDASRKLRVQPRHALADGVLCGAELASIGTDTCDLQLLQASCRETASWSACGSGQGLGMTVALPRVTVRPAALLARIHAARREARVAAAQLEIAFDEADLAHEGPELPLLVAALRDAGIGVAMDCRPDGRLWSRRLYRLPLTTVRLHDRMVANIATDRLARSLAAQMIRAAHSMGAAAVALGVSVPLQRDILADLGCQSAQGALFGRAVSAAAFRAGLRANRAGQVF